jgi:hypothetical protein
MTIKLRSVSHVMVGLSRVGLSGLEQAIERAEGSGSEDRDEIVSLMMEALAAHNYISAASAEAYRLALWREFMRHRGEDIRHLYSEIDMVVRSEEGPELDRFVETLAKIFGKHELKPAVAVEPPSTEGPNPQLLIGGEVIIAGITDPDRVAKQVGRQISDW